MISIYLTDAIAADAAAKLDADDDMPVNVEEVVDTEHPFPDPIDGIFCEATESIDG